MLIPAWSLTVCGLGKGPPMSSVLSVKWCSSYLPSLLLGAALRTKRDSEGFVYGNKHWKVNSVQIRGDGKTYR